jgi:hypothetical protein
VRCHHLRYHHTVTEDRGDGQADLLDVAALPLEVEFHRELIAVEVRRGGATRGRGRRGGEGEDVRERE